MYIYISFNDLFSTPFDSLMIIMSLLVVQLPPVRQLAGQSVGRSVIKNFHEGQLNLSAPIRPLVHYFLVIVHSKGVIFLC